MCYTNNRKTFINLYVSKYGSVTFKRKEIVVSRLNQINNQVNKYVGKLRNRDGSIAMD